MDNECIVTGSLNVSSHAEVSVNAKFTEGRHRIKHHAVD